MAFALIVAGGTLYRVSPNGVVTALTLPSGITLSTTRPPRFAVLGRNVLLTNNPTRSVIIDPDFVVRPMQIAGPVSPPVLTVGAAGALTGAYKVKYTHKVKDAVTGALLAESDYSPPSSAVALTTDALHVAGLSASPDAAVTHHGLYRTLADGEVYYPWLDVDADQTSTEDDQADDAITLIAAPVERGGAPGLLAGTYMTQVIVWKNRVWGVGNRDRDLLRYSGDGVAYAWPATYGLDIPPLGGDEYGIVGLMARRDMLGVIKRAGVTRISGGQPDGDGAPQFDVDTVAQGPGGVGPSIVIRDTGYYLGAEGWYEWGVDGFRCLSDDAGVRKWFATDDYFDRAFFPIAFCKYNERYDTIELHLATLGSRTLDAWITFDRKSRTFWGPHTTAKTTPTSGFTLLDDDGRTLTAFGGADGVVYLQNQLGFSDAGAAIAIDLRTKHHDGGRPALRKNFSRVDLASKAVDVIGNCQVSYRVGSLDAPVSQTVQADLRLSTQVLPRVGPGEFLQLQITDNTNGIGCQLYGYEIPFTVLGNRSKR